MAIEIKNVAVVGGTGYVGKPIVKALVDAGFNVSVFTRNKQTDTSVFPKGVKVVTYELNHDSLVNLLNNQHAVVSTVNPLVVDVQKIILDAAIEAGVRRFVPSEFGTDPREEVSSEKIPSFATKHEFYIYLVKTASQKGIEYTAIATGPFFDSKHLGPYFWGFDITTRTANAWDEKRADYRIATTRLDDLGLAIARVLSPELADRFANQTVGIHSAMITLRSLLEAFEKVTDSKWTLNHIDMLDELEKDLKRLEGGDFSAVAHAIRGLLFLPGINIDFEHNTNGTDDVSEVLGLPQADIKQVVQELVQ